MNVFELEIEFKKGVVRFASCFCFFFGGSWFSVSARVSDWVRFFAFAFVLFGGGVAGVFCFGGIGMVFG